MYILLNLTLEIGRSIVKSKRMITREHIIYITFYILFILQEWFP